MGNVLQFKREQPLLSEVAQSLINDLEWRNASPATIICGAFETNLAAFRQIGDEYTPNILAEATAMALSFFLTGEQVTRDVELARLLRELAARFE